MVFPAWQAVHRPRFDAKIDDPRFRAMRVLAASTRHRDAKGQEPHGIPRLRPGPDGDEGWARPACRSRGCPAGSGGSVPRLRLARAHLNYIVRAVRAHSERDGMRRAAGRRPSAPQPRPGCNCRNHCVGEATEESLPNRQTHVRTGPGASGCTAFGPPIISFGVVDLPLAKALEMWRGLGTVRRTAWRMSRGCAGGPQGPGAKTPAGLGKRRISVRWGPGYSALTAEFASERLDNLLTVC